MLDRLIDASWQGLAAFLAVGLLALIFRRMSPNMRAWLWRLCGLKLLVSLFAIAGVPLLPSESAAALDSWILDPLPATTLTSGGPPLAASAPLPAEPDWPFLLAAAWALGALAFLAYRLFTEITCKAQIFRSATIFTDRDELAASVARSLRLRRTPKLWVSATVRSPLVSGIWNPVIVLPPDIASKPSELELALVHEMAHIKRKDLMWQAVLSLVATVFWFFPPAYLASKFAKGEAEMDCDRLVLQVTQSSPAQYGRLLVRLAAQKSSPAGTAAMAARSRQHLERRILAMNSRPRRPSRLSILLALAVLTPAILPWNAIAQEPTVAPIKSKHLDEIAMRWLGVGGSMKELRLSADQERRMSEQAARADQEFTTFANKLADLKVKNVSDKDRLAYDNSIRMPMFERHLREKWEILTPAQKQRMGELICQYVGPMLLDNAEVAKLIGLPEKSRAAITKIMAGYNAYMKKQSSDHMLAFREQLGVKEIKIRDFTPAEERRMKQINKLTFSASGDQRVTLQKEYYTIRERGIRYENVNFQERAEAVRKWNLEISDRLMEERRKEFARRSKNALDLIPSRCLAKWKQLQGKPFTFEPLPKGKAAFGYR